MKKVKYIGLSFFLCCFSFLCKGQYSIGGIWGSIYVDIVPDTLLNVPPTIVGAFLSYSIDINQDGANDIKVNVFNGYNMTYNSSYIDIGSLDTSTSFSFGSIDSVYSAHCASWGRTTVLKAYNNGDTIKNGKYVTSGYLTRSDYEMNCGAGADSYEWIKNSDQFIGVKYKSSSGVSYGWIRVVVSADQTILIKDFSLGSPVADISKVSIPDQFAIYPNPACSSLQVEFANKNGQIIQLQVLDVMGNIVKQQDATTEKTNIDVSDLQEGIYFALVKTTEGIIEKKIVVQR